MYLSMKIINLTPSKQTILRSIGGATIQIKASDGSINKRFYYEDMNAACTAVAWILITQGSAFNVIEGAFKLIIRGKVNNKDCETVYYTDNFLKKYYTLLTSKKLGTTYNGSSVCSD